MSAVVRVKRRIDEEPLATFVLNRKKRRLDDDAHAAEKDEISTILTFAGTIKEQDNTVTTQFARQQRHKDAAKALIQQKVATTPIAHTERARQEMRKSLHEQRFRIVNCLRTLSTPGDSSDDDDEDKNVADADKNVADHTKEKASDAAKLNKPKAITIVDIERQNKQPDDAPTEPQNPTDSDSGYVYDIYLPENEQQAAEVDLADNFLSYSAYAYDYLVYEDRFNNDEDEEYDSEDSNKEDYYANDYPDEDDEDKESRCEYDDFDDLGEMGQLLRTVNKFNLSDDDDDDDDDNFVAAKNDDDDSDDSNDSEYSSKLYQDPYVHGTDFNGSEPGWEDDEEKSYSTSSEDHFESANEHDTSV